MLEGLEALAVVLPEVKERLALKIGAPRSIVDDDSYVDKTEWIVSIGVESGAEGTEFIWNKQTTDPSYTLTILMLAGLMLSEAASLSTN